MSDRVAFGSDRMLCFLRAPTLRNGKRPLSFPQDRDCGEDSGLMKGLRPPPFLWSSGLRLQAVGLQRDQSGESASGSLTHSRQDVQVPEGNLRIHSKHTFSFREKTQNRTFS